MTEDNRVFQWATDGLKLRKEQFTAQFCKKNKIKKRSFSRPPKTSSVDSVKPNDKLPKANYTAPSRTETKKPRWFRFLVLFRYVSRVSPDSLLGACLELSPVL